MEADYDIVVPPGSDPAAVTSKLNSATNPNLNTDLATSINNALTILQLPELTVKTLAHSKFVFGGVQCLKQLCVQTVFVRTTFFWRV